MNTQEGNNVTVCAIKGNFDDAQTGVKKIFTTPEISAKLEANNMLFSSANSINFFHRLFTIFLLTATS